jgi:hypothetical protein
MYCFLHYLLIVPLNDSKIQNGVIWFSLLVRENMGVDFRCDTHTVAGVRGQSFKVSSYFYLCVCVCFFLFPVLGMEPRPPCARWVRHHCATPPVTADGALDNLLKTTCFFLSDKLKIIHQAHKSKVCKVYCTHVWKCCNETHCVYN